jgi:hypothetical protein
MIVHRDKHTSLNAEDGIFRSQYRIPRLKRDENRFAETRTGSLCWLAMDSWTTLSLFLASADLGRIRSACRNSCAASLSSPRDSCSYPLRACSSNKVFEFFIWYFVVESYPLSKWPISPSRINRCSCRGWNLITRSLKRSMVPDSVQHDDISRS